MGNMMKNLFLILFTVLVMALSIAGPELFARYRDQSVLGPYTRWMPRRRGKVTVIP